MNGVHDLGGMHGFGPVEPERNEPVFHHDWERRTFALALSVMGARLANVDEFRRTIERMPPAHYLDSSYYEHWLYAIESLLKEKGVLDDRAAPPTLNADGHAEATSDDSALWAAPDAAAPARVSGSVALRHDPKYKPRFTKGDRIIARNFTPQGHTRSPRYVRGRHGVIARDWGTFVFPDAHAHGLKAKPQHCYSVEFTARELWGKDFPARDRIYIDLWESYLEADASAPMPVRKPTVKASTRQPRKKNERLAKSKSGKSKSAAKPARARTAPARRARVRPGPRSRSRRP